MQLSLRKRLRGPPHAVPSVSWSHVLLVLIAIVAIVREPPETDQAWTIAVTALSFCCSQSVRATSTTTPADRQASPSCQAINISSRLQEFALPRCHIFSRIYAYSTWTMQMQCCNGSRRTGTHRHPSSMMYKRLKFQSNEIQQKIQN